MSKFIAEEIALDIIRAVRDLLATIRQFDPELADQAGRAATSLALNVAEGARRQGKDRPHLFRVAAGSAAELRIALRVALAWGYLDDGALARPLELLDRQLAILWRLCHPISSGGRASRAPR